MTLLLLALIGIVEACVFVWRYGARSKLHAGASTFAVCALRVLFVSVGVSAWIQGVNVAAAIIAYAGAASLATWAVQPARK